nr:hypothetical protein [Tanacetum cinerariifolium]
MSDSEHSSITYTSVPSPAPLSPDYVPGPEEPEQEPLLPNYVPGPKDPEQVPPLPVYLPYVQEPVYPEYMLPEDNVFPAKEQPLPVAATPTADSPGYIPEFDPKGDLEEDDEEDPANYHADSTVVALPAVDHVPSEEIPESCLPLRKRLRFASPTPSKEVGESSAADATRQNEPVIARDDPYSLVREELYRFVDIVGASEEIAPTTLQGVNKRVTDLSIVVEQETTIMYGMMEEAQDDRSQLRGRVNLLYRDMPVHRHLAVMIEREAMMVCEAWGLSIDARDNARSDVMSLRTTLVAHHALILDLHAPDRSRQRTQMIEFQKHHGPAKGPAQPDAQGEAGRYCCTGRTCANRNGDDSHTSGTGRPVQVARECTYPDFLKCQPMNFKGTKEVVGLSQWFEKMKSVFSISNYTVACQVKFAMCTLQGNALTWWNSHVKTTTHEAAHAMPWRTLKKMMTYKYCPRGEINKLENPPIVNTGANQRGNVCFECGAQGHFKRECPKLKNNNNRVNQVGNAKAQAKVYAVGKAGANPDNNVVTELRMTPIKEILMNRESEGDNESKP